MSSGLRLLLKGLLPPLAISAYRRLFPVRRSWIWEGIYPSLDAVPARNAAYDQDARVAEMVAQAERLLGEVRDGRKPFHWHETLTTLAGVVGAANGKVRVIDFGGGMGTGFIQLMATLPAGTGIRYDVIDLPGVCAAGRKLFAADPRIGFHEAVKDAPADADIVYANSVLQYIADYAGQLRELAAVGAPWLLLARLASGDFASFATGQMNLPGQVVPHWFLNRGEVVKLLEQAGYRLASESLENHEYDVSNFPPSHRSGRMRHLLFKKK